MGRGGEEMGRGGDGEGKEGGEGVGKRMNMYKWENVGSYV